MRILLAEDNTINAKVATLFLTKMGHSTELAKNGKEVLHALEHQPFDVVLMDLEMPVLSGAEAVRLIRNSENSRINNAIPIFALSAHSRDEISELYPHLDVEGYISKPIDKNQLAETLNTIQVAT